MLREQRHEVILEDLKKFGIIKVSDLTERLQTTEMTIRRDLKYLEEKDLLIRIHGGAKSKDINRFEELSPHEKRNINVEKKNEVAEIAASLIKDNDIVYIGPGTTTELMHNYIKASQVKIITNCLNIFEEFRHDDRFELILIGGRFREKTSTFVGSITNDTLERIRVKAAFIGANGISGDQIMTSNEDEGQSQKVILNNAENRYVICDSSKIEREDFYTLYKLREMTALVTDHELDKDLKKRYSKYCRILDKIKEE